MHEANRLGPTIQRTSLATGAGQAEQAAEEAGEAAAEAAADAEEGAEGGAAEEVAAAEEAGGEAAEGAPAPAGEEARGEETEHELPEALLAGLPGIARHYIMTLHYYASPWEPIKFVHQRPPVNQ